MVYTSGVWMVKEGREAEFARAWQQSADATSLEHPGMTFRLLRDVENPSRLVSIAGPWKSVEHVNATRSSESFQEAMASMEELLDSVEISTFELAAEIS